MVHEINHENLIRFFISFSLFLSLVCWKIVIFFLLMKINKNKNTYKFNGDWINTASVCHVKLILQKKKNSSSATFIACWTKCLPDEEEKIGMECLCQKFPFHPSHRIHGLENHQPQKRTEKNEQTKIGKFFDRFIKYYYILSILSRLLPLFHAWIFICNT